MAAVAINVEHPTTPLIPQSKEKITKKELEVVHKCFNAIFDNNIPYEQRKKEFETLLSEENIARMERIYSGEKNDLGNIKNHLPDQKSFLDRFSLQGVLAKMLKDIAKYVEFLKLFINRFAAYNERIEEKYLPRDDANKDKTKDQPRPILVLDAPLHCAVRQLNEDLIEWLLEQPEVQKEVKTEVNLRNGRKETALAILCIMYDWCKQGVPKLKTRLEDIEKEREKADKMQQIWLDDEKIKVSALMNELEEETKMNAPTILKLIKRLLEKGADFNIYMNDDSLPFDFLWKYYIVDKDVTVLVDSLSLSNVAMTKKPMDLNVNNKPKGKVDSHSISNVAMPEKPPMDSNVMNKSKGKVDTHSISNVAMTKKPPMDSNVINKPKSKDKSKKRLLTFYKESEDKDVTVELLEIFICFNNLEKFKHFWRAFEVTSKNVKQVIKLLLHVAVERNSKTYVELITDKASGEIFKPKENETPNPQGKCELMSETSFTSVVASSRTQDETFKQVKNETENSQDTCAGTSKRISMNAGSSCKENATEDAEPQTQSETSKLLVTDAHTESATSNLEEIVLQAQCGTIQSQDNPPVTQDTRVGTTAATRTSDEQPSRWCCLKCSEKKQNPSLLEGTDARAQRAKSSKSEVDRSPQAEGNQLEHNLELKGLLKKVCLNGNTALLNFFLENINDRLLLHENPLVVVTLQKMHKMHKNSKEFKSLQKCVNMLIYNHTKVNIQGMDTNGNTALHLALSYGYDKIASLLLKEGHGLMGLMNKQNLTPIEYGSTQFWNNYLDNCITYKDGNYMRFNVGFLKPRATNESSDTSKSSSSKGYSPSVASRILYWIWYCWVKRVEEMNATHSSKYRFTHTVNDMTALRLISQSKDRKEFLMHPVIIAFITMKWKRLFHWHILNLLLTTLTMGTFIGYTLMPCPSGVWKWIFTVCVIIGTFIISFREIMQFLLLRLSYITYLENYVDILNVAFVIIVLYCGCDRGGVCEAVPRFSSFVVISLAFQATFLLGASWNNLSNMLYMFKTVSSSFFKSFLSFAPLLLAFIYSFIRMFNEPSGISISNHSADNSQSENFNNFRSFWNATIKTLVMTTGEFEAANINYDEWRWLLFVAFVFVAPIVILNLINGLAVSDIAAIRQESEFISVCKRVMLLERYERSVGNFRSMMPKVLQRLFSEAWFPGSFFESYESTMHVKMNELNKISIQKKKDQMGESTSNNNDGSEDTACQSASDKTNEHVKTNELNKISIQKKNDQMGASTSNNNDNTNDTTSQSASNIRNEHIKTNKLNKISIEKKKEEIGASTSNNNDGSASDKRNEFQPIPFFPIFANRKLKYYFSVRTFEWVPYMTLDQCCVDKAKTIAKNQSKNSSGRGTNELVDPEQTDRPALVNKTAMNQPKTSTPSRSGTGPSVSDSRDKQIEILQGQVRSMIAMLNDMQQQLSGVHSSKAESTAGLTGDHSTAQ